MWIGVLLGNHWLLECRTAIAMPRPKKEAGAEPKKRSRTGCWPCKARKVKCGEEKPICANCVKTGEACDYSIRLNWGGRSKKDKDGEGTFSFVSAPSAASYSKANGSGHEHIFSAQHIATAPQQSSSSRAADLPTPQPTPSDEGAMIDPRLQVTGYQAYAPQDSSPDAPSLPANPYALPRVQQAVMYSERDPPKSIPTHEEFRWSPQHRAKRVKLSSPRSSHANPAFAYSHHSMPAAQSPSSSHVTAYSIGSIVNTPVTPNSSTNTESPLPAQPATLAVQDPPDLRRLSVKSLLSDPSEDTERPPTSRSESHTHRTYGYDHGFPDLDVPHNDDNSVVLPRSPDLRRASAAPSEVSGFSGETDARQIAFEPGGYYAQPVAIKLPLSLEPLPPELAGNQMNLLYFHHFIHHTGRILVPHDCPENPFRTILPQMAVRNVNLLHLLLAFSASHRARLLDHPEPANRIAGWMADVLPALRQALDEPSSPDAVETNDLSSLAPLVTAVMLASLEIVTPHTFSIRIPWQQHVQVARQIIVAKGGLHHLAQKADGVRDNGIFFLSRWFAYLDVMGSLSNRHEQPLFGAYLEDGGGLWLVNRDNEEIYQIDCFFGFSGRCIALLAQVAELAALCDRQRIDTVTNEIKEDWRPSAECRQQADELRKRLEASANTVFRGCTHTHVSPSNPDTTDGREERDAEEIYATNEAYHWAGLIHLSRRVLALPSSDAQVQESVQKVIRSLSKVRRGSSAESCLLFPMFSAGCEAQTDEQRKIFMDRLSAVEGWGMSHVGRARTLMQTVWDTGKPWELLVNGEFFG